MRTRTAAPSRPAAVAPTVMCLLVVAVLLAAGLGTGAVPPAGAQPRRVVVVGDSIVLGAQAPVVDGFRAAGWDVTFDAAVSRSTAAGAEAVVAHAGELTDSLVLGLGANDAGNTGAFRQRVEQVMAAAGGVPHVYWLTIPEVRPYYGPANQVLRDAAAAHPNLRVLEWHAVAPQPGMTAGDGLHLTPMGARAMAFVVVAGAVAGGTPTTTEPPPPPTTVPPPTAPATTAPPTTVAPTTVPPATAPPMTTPVPTTEVRATGVVPRRSAAGATGSRVVGGRAGASSDADALLRAGAASALLLVALALLVARRRTRPGAGASAVTA